MNEKHEFVIRVEHRTEPKKPDVRKTYLSPSLAVEAFHKASMYYAERKEHVYLSLLDWRGALIIGSIIATESIINEEAPKEKEATKPLHPDEFGGEDFPTGGPKAP